jgi:predicted phosphodiesterase
MLVAAVLSAWLEYAADGKPHARAVATDRCPVLAVDDRNVPMRVRAVATEAFPDVVCEADVPPGAKHLAVGAAALPRPTHDPRTIVVFGDTGCRIGALTAQACNEPAKWPFPQVARSVAALHPDLVIHVGDYLYREHACPLLSDCGGSPHGDDAAAWNADWFAPAAPLFAAAPLMLVRGNHEECSRNGIGWFRYLAPQPGVACADATDPYAVDFGDLRVVAFDSAAAEDLRPVPARTPVYQRQFALARELDAGAKASFFVTHRPPYTNADERTAMAQSLEPFDAVLAGHIHNFTAMNVTSLPPLLINGIGGAALDANYGAFLAFAAGDLKIAGEIFGAAQFGFGVYTRSGAGWTISLRDPAGVERARCTLANRLVRCRSEASS